MAVKLNGLTAKTNPSSGRYSMRFQTPGEEIGCSRVDPDHELDVEAQEVDQLAAASISAWCAVLDWFSIVAATTVDAPRAGQQLGGAEENGGPLLPGQPRPVRVGVARGVDRLRDVVGIALGARRRARGSCGAA